MVFLHSQCAAAPDQGREWIDQCGRLAMRYGLVSSERQGTWGWTLAVDYGVERIYRYREDRWQLCATRTLPQGAVITRASQPPESIQHYLWRERSFHLVLERPYE